MPRSFPDQPGEQVRRFPLVAGHDVSVEGLPPGAPARLVDPLPAGQAGW